MAEKTGKKQLKNTSIKPKKSRGRPFAPGQSGNPNGRPKGARNKITVSAEKLLGSEAVLLTRKVIDLALAGNMMALKICMDRIIPPIKEKAISIKLPEVKTPENVFAVTNEILKAVASGKILPSEGERISSLLERQRVAIETINFEERLTLLEEANEKKYGK